MSIPPQELFDLRVPTSNDLALIMKGLRDQKKWSQATLAEISGVTERTIQRVENGEPSSVDTRRALARAFKFDDIDTFEKPCPFPNDEKIKAANAELERTTVLIPLVKIDDGRTLRTMVEGTSSYAMEEIGELSEQARESFAAVVDYLSDYNDIRDNYSMSQRLEVDRDIDALIKTISAENAVIGTGLRHAKIRTKNEAPGLEPMDWTNIYFVLCRGDALPTSIRVPKALKFG